MRTVQLAFRSGLVRLEDLFYFVAELADLPDDTPVIYVGGGGGSLMVRVFDIPPAAPAGKRPGPGRPPRDPAKVRQVAVAAIREGTEPGAHRRLAAEFGLSEASVKTYLRAARSEQLQFLAPSPPGRRNFIAGPGLEGIA